jgi:hypothetical protein
MGVGFTRRWTYDPGNSVLTQIEGVAILDRSPPSSIIGVGSGTTCIVGEFENGAFNTVTEVTSATQLASVFGGFGYVYSGVVGQNPCARQRFVDSAVVAEYWNGNGAVQLYGKQFSRLLIVRVNTSVGAVSFTRQANLLGGSLFRYALTTGQHLDVSIDGAGPVVATFTGVAATVTSGSETYSAIVAGDTAVFGVDAQPNFTATFLATDTTQAAVIARINQYAGFTFASIASGSTITLTGIQAGTGGQIRVVSGSAIAGGKLNFTVANTAGTGNVSNIAQVAPSELNTVVHAAVATASVEQLPSGQLRIYRTTNVPSVDSIAIASTTTATAFGFPLATTDAASTGNAGTIPAGTMVQVPSGNQYVTMQDIAVTSTTIAGQTSGAGPYSVPIRPATDDNLTVSTIATVGTITQVNSISTITLDSFAVTNPLPTTAALTDAAIDAAYVTAIQQTLNSQTVAHDINILFSARQSNAIRTQLKLTVQTVGDNGGTGCLGRVAVVRPPIGTLASTAESQVAQPGVGAYSYERIIYTYPGVTVSIPQIATLGVSGGTGFTSTGIVTVGSDGFMACILSSLPPESNPGQLTAFTGAAIGLEPNANGGNGYALADYINFKQNGICGARFTSGTMIFQSGVTSVNPLTYPALAPIHRRRMADYIQDSIATALDPFSKQVMTLALRQAVILMVRTFMISLVSPQNLNQQRIAGFFLDGKTPNLAPAGGVAPTSLGIFRFLLLATTLPSMDAIVMDTQIGDSVVTVQNG